MTNQFSDTYHFLLTLEEIIQTKLNKPEVNSYINQLSSQGIARIAQKVGEEAVETVIEAVKEVFDEQKFLTESADLLFHYLVLLHKKGYNLKHVLQILENRHQLTKKH